MPDLRPARLHRERQASQNNATYHNYCAVGGWRLRPDLLHCPVLWVLLWRAEGDGVACQTAENEAQSVETHEEYEVK